MSSFSGAWQDNDAAVEDVTHAFLRGLKKKGGTGDSGVVVPSGLWFVFPFVVLGLFLVVIATGVTRRKYEWIEKKIEEMGSRTPSPGTRLTDVSRSAPKDGVYSAFCVAKNLWVDQDPEDMVLTLSHAVLHFQPAAGGNGWKISGHGQDAFGRFTITHGFCLPNGRIFWIEKGAEDLSYGTQEAVLLLLRVAVSGEGQVRQQRPTTFVAGRIDFENERNTKLEYYFFALHRPMTIIDVDTDFPPNETKWDTALHSFRYTGPPREDGPEFWSTANRAYQIALIREKTPPSLVAISFEKQTQDTKIGIRMTETGSKEVVVGSYTHPNILTESQRDLLCPGMRIYSMNNQTFESSHDYAQFLRQAKGIVTILGVAPRDADLPYMKVVSAAVAKPTPDALAGLSLKTRQDPQGKSIYINGLSKLFDRGDIALQTGMTLVSINNRSEFATLREALKTIRDTERIVTVVAVSLNSTSKPESEENNATETSDTENSEIEEVSSMAPKRDSDDSIVKTDKVEEKERIQTSADATDGGKAPQANDANLLSAYDETADAQALLVPEDDRGPKKSHKKKSKKKDGEVVDENAPGVAGEERDGKTKKKAKKKKSKKEDGADTVLKSQIVDDSAGIESKKSKKKKSISYMESDDSTEKKEPVVGIADMTLKSQIVDDSVVSKVERTKKKKSKSRMKSKDSPPKKEPVVGISDTGSLREGVP